MTSDGDVVLLGNFWDKTPTQNDNFGHENKFHLIKTATTASTNPDFSRYYWYGGSVPSGLQQNTRASAVAEINGELLVVGTFEDNGDYKAFLLELISRMVT